MDMTRLVVHLFTTAVSLSRRMALELMGVDAFDADIVELDREMAQYVAIIERLSGAMYDSGDRVVTAEFAVKAVSHPGFDRASEHIRILVDDHEDGAGIYLSWAYAGLHVELQQYHGFPPEFTGCHHEIGGSRFPVTGRAKEFMVRFLTEMGGVIEDKDIKLDELKAEPEFLPMPLDVALRAGLRKLNETKTQAAYKELLELFRLAEQHEDRVEEVGFVRRALASMEKEVHA